MRLAWTFIFHCRELFGLLIAMIDRRLKKLAISNSYYPINKMLFIFKLSVYDVTIGYKYRCPSFLDNVFGVDPSEVHIHICHFPIDSIPTSEDEICMWLLDRFRFKDQLLFNFQNQGQFPDQATKSDLPAVKSILNCMTVIILTGICMYCIFSCVWFRLYVFVVCAYLVPATYFNIRPQPILGFFKMWSIASVRFMSDCNCNINIVMRVSEIVSTTLRL